VKLDSDLIRQLQNALNLHDAIELLRLAIQTPSITGDEASFADLLHAELLRTGVDKIVKRDFLPGRPNVWGWRKSAAQGSRILLIGHTDTVHARGWTERWTGTERENPFGGAAINGELWGRGAADLKAGLCTAIMALRVLDQAKLPLSGDVVFAFVGDEESGEPDSGVSAGMKAFASAIEAGEVPRPDLAIYVDARFPKCSGQE
jgi:acetylornithine deacetylase